MTIREFIEAVIEGGYSFFPKYQDIGNKKIVSIDTDSTEDDGYFFVHFFDSETDVFRYNLYELLLDPEAWRAVGKVKGWRQVGPTKKDNDFMPEAFYKMELMVGALWSGKTLEEFIATL